MAHLTARLGGRLAALLAFVLFVALTPLSAGALPVQRLAYPDGIGTPNELWGSAFTHPSAAALDFMGGSVAVSGRWAVVGAPEHAVGATSAVGRATAYRWQPYGGWAFVEDLPLGDSIAYQYAGRGVAAAPDQLFVGIPGRYPGGGGKMNGLVYVYHATGSAITLEQTLSVNATAATGGFGFDIAIDGDTMAISAPDAAVETTFAGAVFIFENGPTGWVQTQRIDPPDPEPNQAFGYSVALQGDDLVIGSPQWGPFNEGHAYTSRRGATGVWGPVQTQSLTPAGGQDYFGHSVAVSNGIMVATAPGRTAGALPYAGMAYVSRWAGSAWANIADLESPASPTINEQFGERAAMSADTLLISSAYGKGGGLDLTGAVYRYTVDTDPLLPPTFKEHMYTASPGATGQDQFGRDLAFDGDTMLAGGPYYSTAIIPNVGAAWFFGGLRNARVRVDTTLAVPMPGLLGNDYSNGGAITASILSAPAHGVATVTTDGAWTYDPTSWFLGTDTFRYRMSDPLGSSDSTVSIEVYPPATKVTASITIKRSASSVRRGRTLKLYGRLSPGALGDHCVVYVKKPGSHTWKLLTTRHAYSITPNAGANWSYSLKPKSRGRYYFKVRFPGDANRNADWSPYLSVRVR